MWHPSRNSLQLLIGSEVKVNQLTVSLLLITIPYTSCTLETDNTLQWRHNERDGVSNHRRLNCLLYCWSRRRSKKTPKLRVTGLCAGNSPVTGEFPAQKASNAENVSIWRRHHDNLVGAGYAVRCAWPENCVWAKYDGVSIRHKLYITRLDFLNIHKNAKMLFPRPLRSVIIASFKKFS